MVLKIDKGIPPNLVPDVSIEELSKRGKNELMRVVFPMEEKMDVAAVANEVEQMLGPQGKAVALTTSNSLFTACFILL